MSDHKNNSVKQLKKNLNTVYNPRENSATRETVTLLNINGRRVEESKTICNTFNEYFSSLSESLMQKKTKSSVTVNNTVGYRKYRNNSSCSSMFPEFTCEQEVLEEIDKLNNTKSPGFDGIVPKIVMYVARPLAHLNKLSFQTGQAPE